MDWQLLQNRIGEWADKTFKDRPVIYPIKKLQEEVIELLENPRDKSEYADCFMCLVDAARKIGLDMNQLFEAVENKLEINKTRTWKLQSTGFYSHEKESELAGWSALPRKQVVPEMVWASIASRSPPNSIVKSLFEMYWDMNTYCSSREFDQKIFKNMLDEFDRIYKKNKDCQSEYHLLIWRVNQAGA